MGVMVMVVVVVVVMICYTPLPRMRASKGVSIVGSTSGRTTQEVFACSMFMHTCEEVAGVYDGGRVNHTACRGNIRSKSLWINRMCRIEESLVKLGNWKIKRCVEST